MNLDLDKVKTILKISNPEPIQTIDKISSVIFSIYEKPISNYNILLTQRSKLLKSHAGQISFPGGKKDEKDPSLLHTALREWEEELGESSKYLEVFGELESLHTGTGFHITPYLALYTGNFQFNINHNEVDHIIYLNLESLEKAPFYSVDFSLIRKDLNRKAHYFDLPEGLLWGATCEIILRFLKRFAEFKRIPKLVEPNLNSAPFLNPKLLN